MAPGRVVAAASGERLEAVLGDASALHLRRLQQHKLVRGIVVDGEQVRSVLIREQAKEHVHLCFPAVPPHSTGDEGLPPRSKARPRNPSGEV